MSRQPLSELHETDYDVVIIGAGINGASSAQHLAAAGYSVLIVDKGDFGSGSTSRSTRMLHCGLRYFETPRPILDFTLAPNKLAVALRMAKASMETRGELLDDSAVRLRPVTVLFPVYRDGPYKPWQVDLAFRLLGRYGPRKHSLEYRRLKPAQCEDIPFVRDLRDRDKLHSIALFKEYMFVWPERICVDAVLDAERMGAVARNYTSAAISDSMEDGRWQVRLVDQQQKMQKATVRARVVLNMAGIWIDQVNAASTAKPARLILGTKGAHIVVKLPENYKDYGIATTNRVGEPHYCLPSQGGHHHIGPTETIYEGDIDDIRVNETDRDFLIAESNHVLPGLNVSPDNLEYTWAGVRPLGFDPDFPKGKRSADIHDLTDQGLPRVFAMSAGPIMTHRIAGREMTAVVQDHISPSMIARNPDYTPTSFPHAPDSPRLSEHDAITRDDLVHAAENEHAVSLADLLVARTGLAYRHRLSDEEIHTAATWVAPLLGWSDDAIRRECSALRQRLISLYQMG